MRLHALIALSLMLDTGIAQAQRAIGRTPDGHPDLQGIWAAEFITRTERPKEASALEATPEEAKRIADAMLAQSAKNLVTDPDNAFYGYDQLAKVGGKFRTSLIVEPAEGKIPFTKAGRELADRFDATESYGFDNPEERPPYERCLSGLLAAPMRTLRMLIPMQIVQTPEYVVLWNEDVQGVRIIPFGDPSRAAIPQFDGRASARWDGDTLVVETTDFRADDIARPDSGPPIVLKHNTRIVERLTRTAADTLLYQYTVNDPDLYVTPWRAEYEFRALEKGAVYEYACHEGNHSIVNMLLAGRLGRQPSPPAH
jgi:hypothetical protein